MKNIPGTIKKCKECPKKFKVKHHQTDFCCRKCRLKYHMKNSNARTKIIKVYQMRECLGIDHRGRKLFKSEGPGHRICDTCKLSPEYRYSYQVDTYKFESRAKR